MANVEMVERKEPKMVQFVEGDVVEGVMLSMTTVQVTDPNNEDLRKPVVKVIVKEDGGDLVAFFCTYDLLQKLQPTDRGHRIEVRYMGEDHSVRRNGNSMKRFQVKVSVKTILPAFVGVAPANKGQQLEDGTFITDSDIPF